MNEKMAKKGIFLIFVIVLLASLASAEVTCNPSSVSTSYNGNNPSTSTSISCTNSGPDTITINKVGSLFNIIPAGPIFVSASGTNNFEITYNSHNTPGTYTGAIYFSDDSANIPVEITILGNQQPQSSGDIIVFPTSQVTTVQQGNQKTQNIIISVPSTYSESITIQSVGFNPSVDPISFGDLNLGQVSPGQSVQIPIVYSGEDAETGTYQTSLNILATNSSGQVAMPTVNIQLQVTSGINPSAGGNLSRPSCSLASTNLQINSSRS
jgi:hypothetical protein